MKFSKTICRVLKKKSHPALVSPPPPCRQQLRSFTIIRKIYSIDREHYLTDFCCMLYILFKTVASPTIVGRIKQWRHRYPRSCLLLTVTWIFTPARQCFVFLFSVNGRKCEDVLIFQKRLEKTLKLHIVAIGNPERHVHRASHRGSKQQ